MTSIANLPKNEITTKTTEEFTSTYQPSSKPSLITREVLTTEVTDLNPTTNNLIKNSQVKKTLTKTTKTTETPKPLISKDVKVIDSSSLAAPKSIPAVIFGIIIPGSCFFIMFLWYGYASYTSFIGTYIAENIELKINQHYFAVFSHKYKPISWETYMQTKNWNSMEAYSVGSVFGSFGLISSIFSVTILNIPLNIIFWSLPWNCWYLSPIVSCILLVIFFFRIPRITKKRNSVEAKQRIINYENHDNKIKLLEWKVTVHLPPKKK